MRIVRIVAVRDTREYEEVGDRWVPIPGSGDLRECSRCGRGHEIHAEVELSDGAHTIVGTGCAAKENMALAKEFRAGEAKAKRLASLAAEIRGTERKIAELHAVRADVARLPVPEVIVRPPHGNEERYEIHCGDARIWRFSGTGSHAEFVESAVVSWRGRRENERGVTYEHRNAAYKINEIRAKLAKVISGR